MPSRQIPRLGMLIFYMLRQIRRISRSVIAIWTRVRFELSVGPLMSVVLRFGRRPMITVLAFILLFARMRGFVVLQLFLRAERSVAMTAAISVVT